MNWSFFLGKKLDVVQTLGDMKPGGGIGDDILQEEVVVCRICMIDLDLEGGETLKMECGCKGELSFVHKKCAIKWFSIKGNHTCEICGQVVQNLPLDIKIDQDDDWISTSSVGVLQWFVSFILFIASGLYPSFLFIASWYAYFVFLYNLWNIQDNDVGWIPLYGPIALAFVHTKNLTYLATSASLRGKLETIVHVSLWWWVRILTMIYLGYVVRSVWVCSTFQFALVILCTTLIFYQSHLRIFESRLLASSLLGPGVAFATMFIINILFMRYWKRAGRERRQQEQELPQPQVVSPTT